PGVSCLCSPAQRVRLGLGDRLDQQRHVARALHLSRRLGRRGSHCAATTVILSPPEILVTAPRIFDLLAFTKRQKTVAGALTRISMTWSATSIVGPLSHSTVPSARIIWNWAGIVADVMFMILHAATLLAPTSSGGVTKSPARPVEATESTAASAKVERTMSGSSFSVHEGGCGSWSGLNDLADGATLAGDLLVGLWLGGVQTEGTTFIRVRSRAG